VVFLDYSSAFHSRSPLDAYEVSQTLTNFDRAPASSIHREQLRSNFLYLDGHVETKEFGWAGGLINLLHKPIRQSWGGVAYESAFSHAYQAVYPY
jgi:prepilin-type processing-associated H-X9-DG protein